METRAWVVGSWLAMGCQPATVQSPTGETLTPLYDGSAFAVDFPPSSAGSDATAGTDPLDTPLDGDAAPSTPAALDDASDVVVTGDDAAGAAPEGACAEPPAPGDLLIDELMVESVAGAGDDGEWLEARSTLGCTVNLLGLHGECPRAAKVITFDVESDLWIPPGGWFIVADSMVPAINHSLPGPIVLWAGHLGDVLRNKGSTVSLRLNDVLIDSVTYPALKLEVGKSWAFPSDCDPSLRLDFSRWQVSSSSWFPGFFGTPNAPNDDVHCP